MQIKEYRVVDVCAEQIITIDQCRLERYLGDDGCEVMKRVDRALSISFGIGENDLVNIENVKETKVHNKSQECLDISKYMDQQLCFWQDIKTQISFARVEIDRLDDEIHS